MADESPEFHELREQVARLTARVYRLEQQLASQPGAHAEPLPMVPSAPPSPAAPGLSWPSRLRHTRIPSTSPDLESRIGSQWLNRVGIIATLIGVAFFLKYAFENNWIGPAGRVSAGLLAGLTVVAWSERFRQHGFAGFSYSLKAVGVGTMYLSVWAAFQLYSLVPIVAAFTAMVAITVFTAVLALRQDALVLAAFALVGGFLTPILLATHQNREIELFSYVALLDVAAIGVALIRPWRRLLPFALLGTFLLFVSWYAEFYTPPQRDVTTFFATLFFVLFLFAPLVTRGRAVAAGEVSPTLLFLPLANAAFFFMELWTMFYRQRSTLALTAVVLAIVYEGLSWRPFAPPDASDHSRQVVRVLYAGLAVTFLTVAIPLQLEGHWITLGWLVESAALLWAGYRVDKGAIKLLGVIVLALGMFRLLLLDVYRPAQLIWNERFANYMVAVGVLGLGAWLARARRTETEQDAAGTAIVALNVVALIALTLEAHDFYARLLISGPVDVRSLVTARQFTYSAVWMSYGALLMWIGFWRRSGFVRWQALVLLAVTIVKVFTYDVSELGTGYRVFAFIALGALLLGISFAYQRDWLKLPQQPPHDLHS